LDQEILPVLGRYLVKSVTYRDIDKLHAKIGERAPIQANRVVGAVSTMFGFAERWEMRPEGSNPCSKVKRFRENSRERYLSEREQARLGMVMREFEADGWTGWKMVVPLRILILTGMRSGEVRKLRWNECDFDAGLLRLKDSKSGPKTIQVSPIVMDLIAGIERRGDFVFPVADQSRPMAPSTTHRWWSLIRAKAGLEDVRIHDLRHTFASAGVNSGLSLPIIGKLLGHSRLITTERYAHLSADPIRAGADRIAQKLSAALDGKPPAEVVPIERGA
jgi:integrase